MIRVEKVTVNIGVGQPGDPLDKAERLLQTLTGQKPLRTLSRSRIPTWGIRPKQQIGVKVTLRGDKAVEFLKRAIAAKGAVGEKSFDDEGNFAFGIAEYIDIPGVKYDPEVGIYGMDVCVTLEKTGYRVKKRKRQKRKIPAHARLKKEEAVAWARDQLGIKVGEHGG
jgi:large subunit ribosomal protein L5